MLTCSECGQPGASYRNNGAWYHPLCFANHHFIDDATECPSIDTDGEFLVDYSQLIGRRSVGHGLSKQKGSSVRKVRLEVCQVAQPVSLPVRRLPKPTRHVCKRGQCKRL